MTEPHAYRLVNLVSRRFSNWDLPCPEPGVAELVYRLCVPLQSASRSLRRLKRRELEARVPSQRGVGGVQVVLLIVRSPNAWDGVTYTLDASAWTV